MKKYQGVCVLSIREYLGGYDGSDLWIYIKSIVGLEAEDGKIRDYKTGEEYDFIDRDKDGRLLLKRTEAKRGNIYAIESPRDVCKFDRKAFYSARQIDKFIKESDLFTDEYKTYGKKAGKVLKK